MRSARTAAWVGDVYFPSSWAASAAELAAGRAPRYSETSRRGVAHLRAEVVPVQLQQPLADHQAQPEEQRELRGRAGNRPGVRPRRRKASWMTSEASRRAWRRASRRISTMRRRRSRCRAKRALRASRSPARARSIRSSQSAELRSIQVPHNLLPPRTGSHWTGGRDFPGRRAR